MVDAGGSQLIVGARVTNCASDRNELVADIAAIPAVLGRPATVLADNGYANGDEVAALAESDIEALVATGSSGRRRRYDFRPAKTEVPVKKPKAEWLKVMAAKLDSEEGRALYRLRQQTVEPVFGIIKAANFTGFSLRGLDIRWPASGTWWRWPTTASPAQAQAGDGRVTALLARQADPKARPQPRSLGDPPNRSVRTNPRGFARNFDRASQTTAKSLNTEIQRASPTHC